MGGTDDYSALTIQVTGTYTGALSLQGTVDGTTWVTLGGNPLINLNTGAYVTAIPSASAGIWQCAAAGFVRMRVTALAAVTGTAVVTAVATNDVAMLALNAPLPAGTAALGTVTLAASAAAIGVVTPLTPTPHTLTSAATTNATSVKASAGTLFELTLTNYSATVKHFKLYNKATAPTVGTDVPVATVDIPAGTCRSLEFGTLGDRFTLGIAYAITPLQTDSDITSVSAGDVKVLLSYV